MRYLVLSVAVALAPMLQAQPSAPIQLDVGSPLVDGRIYKAHEAWAMRSVTKDGATVRSIQYTNYTFLTRWKGVDACVVESKPNAETTDTAFYEKTVLDARSMALLHREERNGAGRLLIADVDGAHVTGQYRAKAGDPIESLDFTLEVPSYYVGFVDAAVGATHIQPGQSWRVPTFSFGPTRRKTDWQIYRITGRQPAGWIIENVDDSQTQTKIWITDDPPYLPLVIAKLSDGSIARFESKLSQSDGARQDTRYPCRKMAEAHQLDFWIGDWVVTSWARASSRIVGENQVHPILDHCIVLEEWTSSSGSLGKSFNFWDPNRKKWRQVWMDDNDGSLDYEGEFHDRAMHFAGWTLDSTGARVLQKLTFFHVSSDTVRQLFEESADSGKTWASTYDLRYVRKR